MDLLPEIKYLQDMRMTYLCNCYFLERKLGISSRSFKEINSSKEMQFFPTFSTEINKTDIFTYILCQNIQQVFICSVNSVEISHVDVFQYF